ncbi:Minor capsid protein [Shewanella sp. phage 1/44]|uniref:head decoration n=1 Tax=Shewanella sp. phage 1/44 TaxID=1458862 RepID=UPI0004F5D1BA|nr:head decoration [Shewanella sp. phage 1/44]AHK11744.1 Minor capsid protein [Shewanella sp. phage 1/44]
MAKGFVQRGKTVTFTAPSGGVVNGRPYKVGSLILVADVTAIEGQECEGHTDGVWAFDKTAADTPAQFAKAYLLADGSAITTVATSNTLIGVFTEAYISGDTVCHVRLNGVSV